MRRPVCLDACLVCLVMSVGCIADGRYIIQGTVQAEGPGGSGNPLASATVEADGGRGGRARVVTGDDGTFSMAYRFGGPILPWGTNPTMRFSAPGYESRSVPLKGGSADRGIFRQVGAAEHGIGKCKGEPRFCFRIDAVLRPRPAATSGGSVP